MHFGSPDKRPAVRLATLRLAGELAVPFTTGILIGIGETREERIDALLALRELHAPLRPHPGSHRPELPRQAGTKMAGAPEPDFDELLWTIAVARLILGPEMNLQAPPNLTPAPARRLIGAGINDWGGVRRSRRITSTRKRPGRRSTALASTPPSAGKVLVERLAVYPSYALAAGPLA